MGYNIEFKSYYFKHFTGVQSNLSANSFFTKALNNHLSVNDLIIVDEFLIKKKMQVLESAMKLPFSAKMIGDFRYAGIKIEADVGAGCTQYVMAFRRDATDVYYPVSVMEEDIRNSTQPTSPIIAIIRKNTEDSLYNEITYISKNINLKNLHIKKDLACMIESSVLQKLQSNTSTDVNNVIK